MALDGPVRGVTESAINELNKLKKSDLIDIIIHKRLPEGLATDKITLLGNFIPVIDDKCEEEFADASDRIIVCGNGVCIRNTFECKSHKIEIDLLQKTVRHLEQRISEQSDFIEIMKPLVKTQIDTTLKVPAGDCDKKSTKTKTLKETVGKKDLAKDASNNIKTTNTEKSSININTAEQEKTYANIAKANNKEEMKHEKENNRLTRKKPIIGASKNTDIQAVQKMGYLHVYRLHKDTTTELLHDFLKRTAPKIDFRCEELKKTEKSASFKVAFPITNVNDVYDPEIWPAGSAVRRFMFPKSENFRKPQATTSQD